MSELRILFIGPAGAGKGTQCAKLSEEFGLEHISTGDLIRAEIKSGSELGNKVKSIVEAGELVSDDIVNEIVKNKLDRTKRFVLDGYPRTKEQAEFLNSVTNLHYIFSLEVNKENLVERLSGRRLCTGTNKPGCKGMFHIAFNPPKVEGKCDLCGSDLYQRKDDNPETIEKRINSYESETGTPLKGFYGDSAKGEFITIEADEAPGMVYEAITSKLKAVARK
ncbi:MAG: nucleoside monophosphate kinase [Candidatus Caenarcaniphilales bacterium]|nr:nucleoside monophosphate kinase [Candidatus Caenarcaniphilales bacterium]